MRHIYLTAVAAAVLLFPVVGWGQVDDCTLGSNESLDWGDITTITSNGGDCEEAARAPAGDDHIIIPDLSVVTAVDDIVYTTADSSLEIQSGGSLIADASVVEDAIVFHFYDGQDSVSVGGTSYDQVALWLEAGGSIDLQAGYLKWRAATPSYETAVTDDNDTLNTVDWFAPCDDASVGSLTGFSIGGAGDCATGSQEYGFSLLYTDDRNNPEDGATGDSYLSESVTEIASKNYDHYLVCFTSGMSRDHCYTFQDGDIDSTGPEYALTLLVTQMTENAAVDQLQFTRAKRAQQLVTASVAAEAGDTCVESAGGLLTADGDYVGTCAYFFDSSGVNGWSRGWRIARTEDGEDCAGGAGGDAWHFASDNPFPADVAIGDKIVISPLCIGQGDKYYVMAPVWLEGEEVDGYAAGNSKILLEGAVRFRGVVISGSGLTLCEGSSCDWNVDDVAWMGCGDDGGYALEFQDTTSALMSCFRIYGGPQAGAGLGIGLDGVTGPVRFSNGNGLYVGEELVKVVADSATPRVTLKNVGIERASKTTAADVITIEDGGAVRLILHDVFTADATAATTNYIVKPDDSVKVVMNGVAFNGQVSGGIVEATTSTHNKAYNVIARGIDTNVGGKTWGGNFYRFGDFRDTTFASSSSSGVFFQPGPGKDIIEGIYAEDLSTNTNMFIRNLEDANTHLAVFNNAFFNATSTHANCSNGTGCWFLYIDPDDDDTTIPMVERNWFLGDVATQWTSMVYSTSTTGDALNFGGNAVQNLDNDVSGAAFKPIDLDATLAADTVQRSHSPNNCVGSASVSGGGGATVVYVDDADQYPTTPILGLTGDEELGRHVTKTDSVFFKKGCGTLTGPRAPGMRPGHRYLYERMGIPDPERSPLIVDELLGTR